MAKIRRLIFEINNLNKSYNSYDALKLKKLDIHPGTIYGVVGTIGSGKTTLLNLMAGFDTQSSGSLLYEGKEYEKNWLGRIKQNKSIFSSIDPKHNGINKTISNYVSDQFPRKKNMIENRYFKNSSFKHLWTRRIDMLSAGELNWLGMIVACECDPRVLLIDDYGMYFNTSMEKDFRAQLIKMNRSLGTTIILSSASDMYLKYFASVLIFLDHGHISKIRTGNSRGNKKDKNQRKKSFQNKKRKYYNRN
ncbi:MAG: hypothetical protein CMG63_03440 [Candidatus Marinimicrobia bacterium]|nr:hypothetical protein [Candidatus Neomarinimicrobiota bacterium]|tara:strand:- start:3111 stop:3857 length:747 start_codon:yes stop_codon:yes gene_type:complete